jgi:transposase
MRGKSKGGRVAREAQEIEGLPVIRRNVAGIDLGSKQHWVCAPTLDGNRREVTQFGATTPELVRLAGWLKERQVESVAMESTGVYWIAPHEVLEAAGFPVRLVDTRQLAQVPGRNKKTDPTDCEWIQRLHSCGLLRGSFRPPEEVCKLRTLMRDKGNLAAEAGDWLRRLQKTLDQMNVRLHRAVADVDGVTGMAILRAIAGGERDARELARLRDQRCRKSEAEIAEQLSGHWREDYLFSLRQSLKMYDTIQERIGEYQQEILHKVGEMTQKQDQEKEAPPPGNPHKAKAICRRGEEPMRQALYRMSGADLTEIDAVGVETVAVVMSEYGPDLSGFPTEKQFVSHLRLAPQVPRSGDKPLKKKRRNSTSTRVAAQLRMAALSLRNSQTALGAYYRNVSRRLGPEVAVFVAARKLATLIYRRLRWGAAYVDEGLETYEKRYQQIRIKSLTAKAKELGLQLLPTQP